MDDMLLPLRRFADFQGRSRRREYWLFILFQWLIFLPLGLAFVAVGGDIAKLADKPFALQPGVASQAVHIAGWLVVGFLVIPMLAVEVRRLHDQDRTGWWILLGLVPFGQLPLFALMCFDGTAGGNRYGADPRRRDTIHRQDWRDAPADQAHMPPRPRLGDG